MPSYKAPVRRDVVPAQRRVRLRALRQSAGLFRGAARCRRGGAGRRRPSCPRRCCSRSTARATREGCARHADGRVTTPKGFKEAYRAYAEGGWVGLSVDPAYGGQGLPYCLAIALTEFTVSANQAFAMYPGLTTGAIAALHDACERGAEAALSAQDDLRRMDRHDEPHRAAMRHRSRPHQDPRRRRSRTAPTRSPARRSSSRPASTT